MSTADLSQRSRELLLQQGSKSSSLVEVTYAGPESWAARLRSSGLRADCNSPFGAARTEPQLRRNLAFLGLGFVFVLSSLHALQSLQSCLFLGSGLGLYALALVYAAMALSCLYGPAFVLHLTPNWTIVLAFVMVALFVSTFFYPRLYTLLPSSLLLGLTLGPLSSAYATILMQLLSRLGDRRYLHLFYVFFNSSQIWGHLLTAVLLRHGEGGLGYPCDADGCGGPLSDSPVLRHPPGFLFVLPSDVSLMLICVHLGMAFVGVALATALLDKLEMVQEDPPRLGRGLRDLAGAVVRLAPTLPLSAFSGLARAFLAADFSMSWAGCSSGLAAVGWAGAVAGAAHTLVALAAGRGAPRRCTVLVALLAHEALLLILMWMPGPPGGIIPAAAGLGACLAVWDTLPISHLASRFPEDWQAPFAAHFLAQAAGLSLGFLSSFHLCGWLKLALLSAALPVSAGLFALGERRQPAPAPSSSL